MVFRKAATLAVTCVKGEHRYVSREGRPAYRQFQCVTLLHNISKREIDLVHTHLDGVEVRVLPWGPGTPKFLKDGWYEVC